MVNGNACWTTGGHQTGCYFSSPSVRPVCCADCVHSAGNGRIVCILACSEATLVSVILASNIHFKNGNNFLPFYK